MIRLIKAEMHPPDSRSNLIPAIKNHFTTTDSNGNDRMRREAPLSVELFLSSFTHFRRHGASLHSQCDGCVAGGCPCRLEMKAAERQWSD